MSVSCIWEPPQVQAWFRDTGTNEDCLKPTAPKSARLRAKMGKKRSFSKKASAGNHKNTNELWLFLVSCCIKRTSSIPESVCLWIKKFESNILSGKKPWNYDGILLPPTFTNQRKRETRSSAQGRRWSKPACAFHYPVKHYGFRQKTVGKSLQKNKDMTKKHTVRWEDDEISLAQLLDWRADTQVTYSDPKKYHAAWSLANTK